MRQYVLGNDIDDICWDVFAKYEVPEDFSDALNVQLVARHSAFHNITVYPIYTIEGNSVSIILPASSISRIGIYDLELPYQKPDQNFPGELRNFRVTYCSAFEIVIKSCEVVLPENTLEIAGIIAPLRGYSAYEVFVKNGFEGTEEDWELFLRKPALDAAATALESAQLADQARLSIQSDMQDKLEWITVSDLEYNDL